VLENRIELKLDNALLTKLRSASIKRIMMTVILL